jgi:hypothetical protein
MSPLVASLPPPPFVVRLWIKWNSRLGFGTNEWEEGLESNWKKKNMDGNAFTRSTKYLNRPFGVVRKDPQSKDVAFQFKSNLFWRFFLMMRIWKIWAPEFRSKFHHWICKISCIYKESFDATWRSNPWIFHSCTRLSNRGCTLGVSVTNQLSSP